MLDLAQIYWQAVHNDGSVLKAGPGTYEQIDRNSLDSFSLMDQDNSVLTVIPGNRTVVQRMKTLNESFVRTGDTSIIGRCRIVALLAPPTSKQTEQKLSIKFHKDKSPQEYSIDNVDSSIYYVYQNGKIEQRSRFSNLTPFGAIRLRPEEYLHLTGKDDSSWK